MRAQEGARLTRAPSKPHPAKFSDPVLEQFAALLPADAYVLDPFAGVGRLAEIPHISTALVEIEPEWATGIVANTLHLPFRDGAFSWIATSPCYGNRMADHHNNQDTCKKCLGAGYQKDPDGPPCKTCDGTGLSKRHTYRHYLDRMPHADSSAILQWGKEYRTFHRFAWDEVTRVSAPWAHFLLSISDHIRKHQVQPVTAFHREALEKRGWVCVREIPVNTRRQKHGQNGEARVENEWVLEFEHVG